MFTPQVILDKNNPTWDEHFEIPIFNAPHATLYLRAFDQDDVGADDVLGQAYVPLQELADAIGRDKLLKVALDTQGFITMNVQLVKHSRRSGLSSRPAASSAASTAGGAVSNDHNHVLRIHLKSAANLINADAFSASDPYVRFAHLAYLVQPGLTRALCWTTKSRTLFLHFSRLCTLHTCTLARAFIDLMKRHCRIYARFQILD